MNTTDIVKTALDQSYNLAIDHAIKVVEKWLTGNDLAVLVAELEKLKSL